MNHSDIPSSSQDFPKVPDSVRTSSSRRRFSRRDSGVRSIHSPTVSRDSTTSWSIKIFADVKDLLGIQGGLHLPLPDHSNNIDGFRSPSPSIHELNSVCVEGQLANHDESRLIDKVTKIDQESDGQISTATQEDGPATTAAMPEWEASRSTPTPDTCLSSPCPPAQIFQHHHRSLLGQYERLHPELRSPVLPESELREKQSLRVNKLLPAPPYHSFTGKKKLMVVVLISLAACLSSLSSIIYFPALNSIASDFKISKELVLLTISVFLVLQGITPVFRLPLESRGRRPLLVGTLFVFSGASIGLVFTRKFANLLILRALQGGGSAALTSIGASVIGDISTTEERGELIGILGSVLIASHFISPVIGAILNHFLGFRSIFWVLFIFAATIMFLILLLLPETLQSIAGNGTVKLGLMHRPFWSIFKSRDTPFNPTMDAPSRRPSLTALVETFNCFQKKNVMASIVLGSIVYAVWLTVLSTTTLLFQSRFHLSNLLIGVAFFPSGAGSILSYYLTGYLMDRDYRIIEVRYRDQHNIDQNAPLDPKSLANLPVYRSGLRSLWWIALIFIATTAGYGFSFHAPSIALPLVLQFFIAFGATAVLFLNGVLVGDTYSGCPASVMTIVNMIRFSCGALAVGTVQFLFRRLGYGFTFLTLALIVVAAMPILLVQWVFGVGRERENGTWWRWPSKFKNFG